MRGKISVMSYTLAISCTIENQPLMSLFWNPLLDFFLFFYAVTDLTLFFRASAFLLEYILFPKIYVGTLSITTFKSNC